MLPGARRVDAVFVDAAPRASVAIAVDGQDCASARVGSPPRGRARYSPSGPGPAEALAEGASLNPGSAGGSTGPVRLVTLVIVAKMKESLLQLN